MAMKTLLAPAGHRRRRAVHLVLWFLLPLVVRVRCARSRVGTDLAIDPPKKAPDKNGPRRGSTAAAPVEPRKKSQHGEEGSSHGASVAVIGVGPPNKTEEKGAVTSGGAAAAATVVVGSPEMSSIQGIDIPFVQKPGRSKNYLPWYP